MSLGERIDLLRTFLTRREKIVERIEGVLSAQRKPVRSQYSLSRQIEECFDARATPFRDQLEEAHWAAGFKPRPVSHLHNDLIDPAEMMVRAVHCWQQTRWPGSAGRMHYAHTLFNLYVLRCLHFLSMRVFDGGRLAEIQGVLDELWAGSPPGQPAFVRDARWLIPLAQSLITDALAPYFEVAQKVTERLLEADALEVQKAHVRMLGGHLTSQIRYYCFKDDVAINDLSVVLRTRSSNALDFALLVQGLVALLKAYDGAVQSGDERMRIDMAGAILQGVSADPELFLHRVELLSAYTMIEDVFITSERIYSPQGQRHVELVKEYGELVGRMIEPLRQDLPRFKPVVGGFSSYGVLSGLPSTLIEHMALKALQHDAETRFSLEDAFNDDTSASKLAWVNGWRELPHIPLEVRRQFEYPQQFAEEIYSRIERELAPRDLKPIGRLYIESGDNPDPDLARYFCTSDKPLLTERREGHFLVSYETPGGWIALKKELLTQVIGAGRDARISGVPDEAAQVLRLMCAGLG